MVVTGAKDHRDKVLKINSSIPDCSKASIKPLIYTFGVGLCCPHLQAGPRALAWRGAGVCDPLCPPGMKHSLSVAPIPKILCSFALSKPGEGRKNPLLSFYGGGEWEEPTGAGC